MMEMFSRTHLMVGGGEWILNTFRFDIKYLIKESHQHH
jgi:hypothetical protein